MNRTTGNKLMDSIVEGMSNYDGNVSPSSPTGQFYGTGTSSAQEAISALTTTINELKEEADATQRIVDSKRKAISDLDSRVAELNALLTKANAELSTYESCHIKWRTDNPKCPPLRDKIRSYESQIRSLNEQRPVLVAQRDEQQRIYDSIIENMSSKELERSEAYKYLTAEETKQLEEHSEIAEVNLKNDPRYQKQERTKLYIYGGIVVATAIALYVIFKK